MQIAIDSQNRRVFASIGQLAICPCCHSPVKAFCGETNIFHWRHTNKADCDSWYEPESQWHVNWKNEFPVEWREVVINKEATIHRADILTSSGVVLELQNSPISAETIREREVFYKDMVWLINCNNYRGNIKTKSLLDIKLAEHRDQNEHIESYDPEDYVDIRDEKKRLNDLNKQLDRYRDKHNQALNKRRVFENAIEYSEKEVLDYLRWFSHSYIYFSSFNFEEKEIYKRTILQIESIHKQMDKVERVLKRIMALPTCEINGYENYVYIDKTGASDSNYTNYILVDRRTIHELFPSVSKAKSELDFSMKVNLEYYLVALNPESDKKAFEEELMHCKTDKDELEELKLKLINSCEISLRDFAHSSLESTNQEIEEIGKLIIDAQLECSELEKEISEKIERQLEFFQQQNDESIINFNNEKEIITKKYTNMLTLSWKYRHRSWDNSISRKFLDMGTYILEVIDFNIAKRMSKNDFVKLVMNLNVLV